MLVRFAKLKLSFQSEIRIIINEYHIIGAVEGSIVVCWLCEDERRPTTSHGGQQVAR